MLKEDCANHSKICELAKEIREERLAYRDAANEFLDQLCQYTASLKQDQIKLDESSSSDLGL